MIGLCAIMRIDHGPRKRQPVPTTNTPNDVLNLSTHALLVKQYGSMFNAERIEGRPSAGGALERELLRRKFPTYITIHNVFFDIERFDLH